MRSGAVAMLLGGGFGVVVALVWGRSTETPPREVPRAGVAERSAAARATPSSEAKPATGDSLPPAAPAESGATAPGAPSNDDAPAASALPATPAPNAPSTPAGVAASSASGLPFPLATPLPPVTNEKELKRAEIRCYEVDPEECGRAADAYDDGLLVPRDAARAEHLRKVELTRLVRRCEERSPHACLVLAGRYAAGQGVDENERHARALAEHARDLCRHSARAAECAGGEPK